MHTENHLKQKSNWSHLKQRSHLWTRLTFLLVVVSFLLSCLGRTLVLHFIFRFLRCTDHMRAPKTAAIHFDIVQISNSSFYYCVFFLLRFFYILWTSYWMWSVPMKLVPDENRWHCNNKCREAKKKKQQVQSDEEKKK